VAAGWAKLVAYFKVDPNRIHGPGSRLQVCKLRGFIFSDRRGTGEFLVGGEIVDRGRWEVLIPLTVLQTMIMRPDSS
jgi:hypothetical protein